MAEIVGVSTWLLAAVRWEGWRNWQKYYPIILYFLLGDALYYYVSYTHRLWSMEPTWPLKNEVVCIAGEFIVFACTILIFMGKYPSHLFISFWWTAIWVMIYTENEAILLWTWTFSYYHGWPIFHSFLFNILLFILLRLHYKKPLWTMFLSIRITTILILINDIPLK